MWLLSELIAYRFILERPLSDLLASRLLWFSETGTHRIPEGFFFESHPAVQGEELRVHMDSFRALCSVVDFGTSRGSILSKVHEP